MFFPELFAGVASKTMPVENRVLDHPQVCMVSNSFKGQQQIPVPVNEKTYYGCCRKCVVKLQHSPGLRYSTDPLTGRNIDKAKAVITYDPERYPAVLYFETKANAENYLEVDLTERIHKTGQTPDNQTLNLWI